MVSPRRSILRVRSPRKMSTQKSSAKRLRPVREDLLPSRQAQQGETVRLFSTGDGRLFEVSVTPSKGSFFTYSLNLSSVSSRTMEPVKSILTGGIKIHPHSVEISALHAPGSRPLSPPPRSTTGNQLFRGMLETAIWIARKNGKREVIISPLNKKLKDYYKTFGFHDRVQPGVSASTLVLPLS